jgi:hypothetical protein
MQKSPAYPHLCRTLDIYRSRRGYLLWSSTREPQ